MADLPSTARVVIIGGGAVGVSALFHLARRGWTDCLLLEANELTSGSTWHAAGNVPTFSASWAVMNMQRYSTELYRTLGDLVDYPINYHVTGAIRLAHSRDRMLEFERVVDMSRSQGLEVHTCTVAELVDRYPFLQTHDLVGGLYDPVDGDIDPAQLTQALAKGARDLGCTIARFCPVTGVHRDGTEWVVESALGTVRSEYVVNAAGYRARQVGALFGRAVPMVTMAHQYLVTEESPAVARHVQEQGRKLPLLRDVDASYYLRQEKNGFVLGPYERNGQAHWSSDGDPMPDDFSFQLFPDALDRIETYIEDAMARVPPLAEVGVSSVVNGPIPYAPDGVPLIGPMPGVPNAFEACVFTFGIAQAGGAGKVLAEWIVDGATEWDMWACDPRRFTGYADQDYATRKGLEVYGHEYAMHFPQHEWPAGRGKRVSPLHATLVASGAQMGVYGGWERANWFSAADDDTSEAATQTWDRAGPWQPRVEAECLAVKDAVGLLDLPGFSRFEVSGEGAGDWIRSLCTGAVARSGRVGLLYFADARGRVVTEMSIVRFARDHFWLITAAPAEWHDRDWLQARLPTGSAIRIENLTDRLGTLILAGPRSRETLAGICDGCLSLGWLTHQAATLAGHPVRLIRVSFTGELGWEIHADNAAMPAIHAAVLDAGARHGLRPFGMYALNCLRIEKGYRAWKADLSSDYTLLESDLARFIRFDKGAFPGHEALLAERERGPSRRFVSMRVDLDRYDVPYMASVWSGADRVGEVTSGAWGYRVGFAVALGTIETTCAKPGTRLEVEVFGQRYPAVVEPRTAVWDPENHRLMA